LVDHTTDLLHDLVKDRASCDASSRPLIFVAHSMGGLVCKMAILRSRNNTSTHLREIFDCTKGVVFIDTPHKGSWVAEWATIPISALGLLKSTNIKLLDVLQIDNQLLESIGADFAGMVRECEKGDRILKITCFFKELPLSVFGKVVSKESATFEGHDPIAIHANHRDMVRFAYAEDNGFKRLLGELTRWVSQTNKANMISMASKDSGQNKSDQHYTPKAGQTFRVRVVPLEWDGERLQSLLVEQDSNSGPNIRSLADEVDGRSRTATITFAIIPHQLLPQTNWSIPLVMAAGQLNRPQTVTLDDSFLGITTLYAPPPQDHKVE
jgi:hypothetical protein